tara:strand:- start:461 stop:1039 length:579 start_codon:yes stop_codon:yes gene_type:complete
MKFTKIIEKIKIYPILIVILGVLTSCGNSKFFDPPDLRKIPGNAKEKREKNLREGKGFRINNMIGNKGGVGSFEFASSNEMWRASLELLDFTPLQNVDYSGGIIVTDWFSENDDDESIKITIRFLSNEIRADGLKVIIHKKVCKKIDNCIIKKIDSTLGQEIKLAILKKASIIKEDELIKDPDYKEGRGNQE